MNTTLYLRCLVAMLLMVMSDLSRGAIIYVNPSATGSNNGTSWENARTSLKGAMQGADPGDTIWVVRGIYRPALPTDPSPRHESFPIKSHVRVLGGFMGTEQYENERNPYVNVTVLSGDINGDDSPGFVNRGDNSYHVVTAVQVNQGAIDGFTIRGGNANSLDELDMQSGGGIWISGSPPVGGRPAILRCVIRDNEAARSGGGVACINAGPFFDSCVVLGNRAGLEAGGLMFRSTTSGSFTLWSSTIVGNSSNATGATGNGLKGENQVGPQVWGCIFWANGSAGTYGTSAGQADIGAPLAYPSVHMTNIEGDDAGIGLGNYSADPRFINALGPDGQVGSGDEDLRIRGDSPCIDRVNRGFVSGNCDATDLAWGPRNYNDPRVSNGYLIETDSGAFEFPGQYCPSDLDGDNTVTTSDLVIFLGSFGKDCVGPPHRGCY